jgi:hypothetical protein
MVKSLALQVAADGIAVKAVLSAGVDTNVIHKKAMCQVLRPHVDNPDQPRRHARRGAAWLVEPQDVCSASESCSWYPTDAVTSTARR